VKVAWFLGTMTLKMGQQIQKTYDMVALSLASFTGTLFFGYQHRVIGNFELSDKN